jgi:hypothetical protein
MGAVRSNVHRRARGRRGGEGPRTAVRRPVRAAVGPGRPDHQPGWRLDQSVLVALVPVLPAADHHIQLDPCLGQERKDPGGGHHHPGPAGGLERPFVARGEVHGGRGVQETPGQVVGPVRPQPLANDRDGPFGPVVEMGERPALGRQAMDGLHPHPQLLEPLGRPVAEAVGAQGGEEHALLGQLRQLHRGHRPAAPRLLPGLGRVHDLTGARHVLDPGELDPFHVSDHGHPHAPIPFRRTRTGSDGRPSP